jgi:hypothetical protein
MILMRAEAKLKVSLTLSADVVALVDRDARLRKDTRSAVVEQWLRRAAGAALEKEIEAATAAYYHSLRDEERAEDSAIARALSGRARRVSYDETPGRRRGAR